MIQDILPRRFSISYQQKPIDDGCIVLCFQDSMVLCADGPELRFPLCQELGLDHDRAVYLFNIDGSDFYLAQPDNIQPPAGFNFQATARFRELQPQHLAFAGVTAMHLNNWYGNNRFCGRCGAVMEHSTVERMMHCPSCDNMVYPRISPVIIVGVYHSDKLLMTKYAGRAYAHYALVAGFIEVGECVEDAVRREVMEEVGLTIKRLRYYKSQPWGFSDSLLMGYYAELDGDEAITLDTNELSEGVWVPRDDIQVSLDNISLTNEMIHRFKYHAEELYSDN